MNLPIQETKPPRTASPRVLPLALGSLGVVYGDIGTSPLYAIKECFHGPHAVGISEGNIMGVLSLVFWSLTFVVSIKYAWFIMLADNQGEGGIFALLALLSHKKGVGSRRKVVALAAVFGAALLYGDGMITPAISVLSAVEGLGVGTGGAKAAVLPITCAILMALFLVQRWGTGRVGMVFGPIMTIWFSVIAALGLWHVALSPGVLAAINPLYGLRFFEDHGFPGIVVLGSVVLCITGAEALYADMGHFGRKPMRLSWFALVYPVLVLNYFGQGALLLKFPEMASHPFYGLVPTNLHYPMVILSTAATIIASQAIISGVFSLAQQTVQLGYCPRLRIVHTSEQARGQIYIPAINFGLMAACVALVVTFQSSGRLAGAYGVAVTGTMTITSLLYFFVTQRTWDWPAWKALPLVVLFMVFDFSYFGANLLKLMDGGWFPIAAAFVLVGAMTTWNEGREEVSRIVNKARLPVETFLKEVDKGQTPRVPGTAVFLTLSPEGVPPTLVHHFKMNEALHRRVIFLTILSADIPRVSSASRVKLLDLGSGFYRLLAWYGFMETPNVPRIIRRTSALGLDVDPHTVTYYLGRESLFTKGRSRLKRWRKWLFIFMSRNASNPTAYFGIPPQRVIEVGMQLAL
jgi:KUP system potassium uptake protein